MTERRGPLTGGNFIELRSIIRETRIVTLIGAPILACGLIQCSTSELRLSCRTPIDAPQPTGTDESDSSRKEANRWLEFAEREIRVPCSLRDFTRDSKFKELLLSDGAVGATMFGNEYRHMGLEPSSDTSLFVLQPECMAETYKAVYFVVSPGVGTQDLLRAIEQRSAKYTVEGILVSR